MILPLLPLPCVLLESLRRSDTRSSCLIENSGAVLHSCLGLCEKSFMSPKLSYRYSVAEIDCVCNMRERWKTSIKVKIFQFIFSRSTVLSCLAFISLTTAFQNTEYKALPAPLLVLLEGKIIHKMTLNVCGNAVGSPNAILRFSLSHKTTDEIAWRTGLPRNQVRSFWKF